MSLLPRHCNSSLCADPPRFTEEDLSVFSQPVVIKVGQNAVFQLPFHGLQPVKMQWFREGEELLEDQAVRIERSPAHSRLMLSRCSRKNAGEIKFRMRNDHGTTEVITQLVVLGERFSSGKGKRVEQGRSRRAFSITV